MKAKGRPRFDTDTLRDLAGEKAFARGEAYHRSGLVEILSVEPGRVLARVAGTEDYRTVLTGRGTAVGGECSCRAFEDWGFCKHMVAVALAANAGENGNTGGTSALARIREHLKAKGIDALAQMILNLAERDAALFAKLDMAAATADTDDKTLEARLRKAIDSATRTREYIDYRHASGWADGVREALAALADLIPAGRAGLVLKLTDHALSRIEQAAQSIDDSDGHCGALLHRVRDVHLAACQAERPDPVRLARELFTREIEPEYDTFSGAAALYADVLGKSGLREYRRLALEAWEKLPTRGWRNRAQDISSAHLSLKSILDFFAEREGDVETRVALRAKDLSSPWDYLQLAEFCRAQGREAEALRRAEEGLWVFEDEPPDERLVLFAVDLLLKAGREADAQAHLWRVFEKEPSLALYRRLRKLCGKAAVERMIKAFEARLSAKRRSRWDASADLLIRILMEEKMFDAAWAAARTHEASRGVKQSLAEASAKSHPREALEVYVERVEGLVTTGGNSSYAEAARLIGRMAALRAPSEQAAYIADIKLRHGRRRNFMKVMV
jgi:uncharacterized Zn finger protein